MPLCGTSCAVPSCASAPVVGLGSGDCNGFGRGFGSGFGYGYGLGFGGLGGSVSAECLGVLAGVVPSCINQVPPSEVTIQPPAVTVTIPGPILSASCEPVAVGGHTPCASNEFGLGGFGGGFGSGFGSRGFGRCHGFLGRRGSNCYPCN